MSFKWLFHKKWEVDEKCFYKDRFGDTKTFTCHDKKKFNLNLKLYQLMKITFLNDFITCFKQV